MTPGYIKLPQDKFVVAHSEDVSNGRVLLMNIGKSSNDYYDVDIIVYEIDNDGDMYKGFGIIPGVHEYKPRSSFSKLSIKDKKKIMSALFAYGVQDER